MRVVAGALLAVLAVSFAGADEIVLLSGGRLMGIAREEGDTVVVETTYGIVSVPRDQVISIDKTKRSLIEEFKAREAETDYKDAGSLWDLARWAKDNNLPRQAKTILQKVVELNPNHEFARRELGYYLFQGQWLTYDEMMMAKGFVRHRNKWLTSSERELMVRAEFEEKVRKDEERRKRDEARKPKPADPAKPRPAIDEQNPAPIFTMAGNQTNRSYYPGYNIYGAGYAPAYGISTRADFRTYLESLYGFYGLHPANYVTWWPFYGNTPWKTPPFLAPIAPQPPAR
jgi:hypothetical protein